MVLLLDEELNFTGHLKEKMSDTALFFSLQR